MIKHRQARLALVVGLVLAAAACGDDDDSDADATTPPAATADDTSAMNRARSRQNRLPTSRPELMRPSPPRQPSQVRVNR